MSLVISFVGIIIITLYVSFEKSFDRFHKNIKSVYLLETLEYGSWIPATMGKVINENIPEVEHLVILTFDESKISTPLLIEKNTKFQTECMYASNDFFKLFTFPLIHGDPAIALDETNTVVLTQTLADKLFAGINPLGETVLLDGEQYKITGVMGNLPKNSSFKADCIISLKTLQKDNRRDVNEWSEWSFNIFVKIQQGADPDEVSKKIGLIPVIVEQTESMKEKYSGKAFLFLSSLYDLHFINHGGGYVFINPVMLKIWIMLAIILAIMGAVNFINFSTSQASTRAKSLSINQMMGATRLYAMGSILAESIFLSMVALVISIILYLIGYTLIGNIFSIDGLFLTGRYYFLIWFILGAIGFGILAGIYPARYITSSPLIQTVKGKPLFSGKGKKFRNTLVTIQFVFAIVLMASAFIIEKQLDYWRNFNLGFNKEQVVYLSTTEKLRNHSKAFADELMKNPDIENYTYSSFIPGHVYMGWGREVEGQYIQLKCWPVDERFLDFFGIKMAEGRKFQSESEADINTFILNKKAVEKFGWNNPLERKINGFDFEGLVIGVAENFNFSSLKDEIEPMQFWLTGSRKYHLMLRVKPGNYTQTLSFIKNTAKRFDNQNEIEVKFLDEALDNLYKKEGKIAQFIVFVTIWCILLAMTGLLGLVIFICRDRVKEIGIRKVNGTRVFEILALINKDFVTWILIAFIISIPLTWYAMNKWLQNFAYKTEMSWWVFALSGIIALVIALLTVSWQTMLAATRNPVEALRYE
jgi:putative ABC transport system permease protein